MSIPSFSSFTSPSSHSFLSSPEFPSSVAGLHLVGAFAAFQVDSIVAAQSAKRRGGPKRAVLAFDLLDERRMGEAAKIGSVEMSWKTIAGKAFSNRDNIRQYERNPFAAQIVRMQDAESASARCVVVLHGAKGGKGGNVVSNTVGVNLGGKQLQQHPRFLLSSGKGEEGARSSFLVYHSNRHARVRLAAMWIEHRELKVTLEQVEEDCSSDSALPIVSFVKNFKPVYQQKEEAVEPASAPAPKASARRAAKWASAAELQQQQKGNFKPFAFSSTAAATASSSSSFVSPPIPVSHQLSALPPAEMPPALVQRMMRRKRAYDDSSAAAASSSSSSASHTLDCPAYFPRDDEDAFEEPACKKEKPACKKEKPSSDAGFEWMAAAAMNFSGFESFDAWGRFHTPNDLIVEDALLELSDEQLADGANSPASLASDEETPRLSTTPPPFRASAYDERQNLMAIDHHGATQSSASSSASSDMEEMMNEAEEQLQRFQPTSPFSSGALSRPMHGDNEVPLALKTAHLLTANPFMFQAFGAAPQISPSFCPLTPPLEPALKAFSLGAESSMQSPQPCLLLPSSAACSPPPPLFDELNSINW